MSHSTSADTKEADWLRMHKAYLWLRISFSAVLHMYIPCEPVKARRVPALSAQRSCALAYPEDAAKTQTTRN